jgi:hypothetical protein
MTVVDVYAGGVENYAERVQCWARSVRKRLDTADAERVAEDGRPRD